LGGAFTLDLIVAPTSGIWFNPGNATRIPFSVQPPRKGSAKCGPTDHDECDDGWVLVLPDL
jgi:hypothetical protein